MTSVVLIAVAVVFLALAWRAIRGEGAPVRNSAELAGQTRAVDLTAFKTLLDPADDEYLRARLSARDFRRVQRMRTRAAMEYLVWTAHNAAVLLRVGEAAARSDDAAVARLGRELAQVAISVRLRSLVTLYKLSIRLVFPDKEFASTGFVESYGKLRQSLAMLTQAQNPSAVSSVSAAI